MGKLIRETENPVYQNFLEDIEVDLSAEALALDDAWTRVAETEARVEATKRGIKILDLQLVDAAPKERAGLIASRVNLTAESEALVTEVREVRLRLNAARVTYLKRVQSLAWQYGNEWAGKHDEVMRLRRPLLQQLASIESSSRTMEAEKHEYKNLQKRAFALAKEKNKFYWSSNRARSAGGMADTMIKILEWAR